MGGAAVAYVSICIYIYMHIFGSCCRCSPPATALELSHVLQVCKRVIRLRGSRFRVEGFGFRFRVEGPGFKV